MLAAVIIIILACKELSPFVNPSGTHLHLALITCYLSWAYVFSQLGYKFLKAKDNSSVLFFPYNACKSVLNAGRQ